MLTLKEAQLTFKTINLLATFNILPFRMNAAQGRLERVSRRRFQLWGFCALCTAVQIIHSISQAVLLYGLTDRTVVPIHIAAMHIMYVYIAITLFPFSLLTLVVMYDLIPKLVNELFKGKKQSKFTNHRIWENGSGNV